MFSVIIPTMWKAREIEKQLPLLETSPFVGEVLLINNNIKSTPTWFKMTSWSKIKTYTPPNNIFVNPAFNIGVASAKFDQIALQQDDVVYDPTIFGILETAITPTRGPVGPNVPNIHLSKSYEELSIFPTKEITLRQFPFVDYIRVGWAALMMFHKSNWLPIDENLKIHLGEEWIVYNHYKKGLIAEFACGFHMSALSVKTTTDLPQFKTFLEEEGRKHSWIHEQIDKHYNKSPKT